MTSRNETHSSVEPQKEDPGAYPIPFSVRSVQLGSRLDSIPVSLRFWAVGEGRANVYWVGITMQFYAFDTHVPFESTPTW